MCSAASLAISSVVAATAATAWPWYRTFVRASMLSPMSRVAARQPLNRRDGSSLRFRREHEARRHQPAIEQDGAGAAIPRGTALLGPGETESIAKRGEQRFMRIAEELRRLAVDRRLDV